jgi:hypothetical protein
MITENTLERMSISPLTYNLIIELCPERGEDAFEVLNRGVELLGLAWNEFNISCSLIPFSPASGSPASGPQTEELEEMKRHIREFNSLHQHVIPPDRDLQNILGQDLPNDLLRILGQEKDFDAVLPAFTLHAAERIFEEDKLGSIDPGKRPGLNLITLPDPHSVQPLAPASLKVLV